MISRLPFFFFFYIFCLVSKKTGLAHYGYIDSSLDSVQPNILEYTISIQCGCIVHLHVVSHAPCLIPVIHAHIVEQVTIYEFQSAKIIPYHLQIKTNCNLCFAYR